MGRELVIASIFFLLWTKGKCWSLTKNLIRWRKRCDCWGAILRHISLTDVLHFQVDAVVLQLVSEDPGPAVVRLLPAPSGRPPVLAQERHFCQRTGCKWEEEAVTENTWRHRESLCGKEKKVMTFMTSYLVHFNPLYRHAGEFSIKKKMTLNTIQVRLRSDIRQI